MAGKSIVAGFVVGAVCCSLASCILDYHHVDAPPKDHDAAARWWLETTDHIPADLRAVYVAASDAHLARHSSATYIWDRCHANMISRLHFELRLPCPSPPDILARLREQVRPGDIDSERSPTVQFEVHAGRCVGCSKEEAERIWKEAIKTARTAGAGKRDTAHQPTPPANPGEVSEPGR